MKLTVGGLRSVIREALESADVARRLDSIASAQRPYLKGQWQPINKYSPEFKDVYKPTSTDGWYADDPELGRVYLTFGSGTSYKMAGRLRVPSGTRHEYKAALSNRPFGSYGSDGGIVFTKVGIGEGERAEKARQDARLKMWKLFGIDPLSYLGPIEPPKPEPAPSAAPATTGEETTPAAPTGEKQYKIYGRKGGSPAHTRFKGKAYVAGQDTRFKPGDKATVSSDGNKLKVKQPDSDHTQSWEEESNT